MRPAQMIADTWVMHGDVGAGWMALMMVVMVLFWAAIIFGVIWLVRNTVREGSTAAQTPVSKESPVEILERRFAQGAMTPEDYRTRRQVLENGSTEPNGTAGRELPTPS
jgi:putative membrane protein